MGGWASGFCGMLIFSLSLPATKLAVARFSPIFLTTARASIAAVCALCLLLILRAARPKRDDVMPLLTIAGGVVVGFPLLTALALQHITSAHSMIFIGLLPLATAIFGVVRCGERPHLAFWVCAVLGGMLVAGFALVQSSHTSLQGDAMMFAAIIICGLGYAEGAKLTRKLGGWQTISWALLAALPVMAPLAVLTMPGSWHGIGLPAWLGLGYVSLFSMLIGFVFWYRGLALGGIASVGQLQLLQPFFGLVFAGLLLHETIGWPVILVSAAVVFIVASAKRFAV